MLRIWVITIVKKSEVRLRIIIKSYLSPLPTALLQALAHTRSRQQHSPAPSAMAGFLLPLHHHLKRGEHIRQSRLTNASRHPHRPVPAGTTHRSGTATPPAWLALSNPVAQSSSQFPIRHLSNSLSNTPFLLPAVLHAQLPALPETAVSISTLRCQQQRRATPAKKH